MIQVKSQYWVIIETIKVIMNSHATKFQLEVSIEQQSSQGHDEQSGNKVEIPSQKLHKAIIEI